MFLRWKIRFFTKRRGATGLKSLDVDCEKHWIGWPGVCVEQKTEKDDICCQLEKNNYHPVFLSDEQYKNYYEGYSNSTLWPLCIIRKTKCFDFWERNVLFSKTKRSFFRTPTPPTLPFSA